MPTSRISGCESMRLSPGDGGQPSPATCLQSHNQPGSGPGPAPATALLQSPSSLASLLWPCLLNACLKLFTNRRFWKNGLKLLWVKRLLGGYEHLWWRGEAGFEMYMPVYNCMKNRFLLVEVYVLSIITRHPHVPGRVASVCPDMSHVSWSGSRVTRDSTQYSVQQGWEISH